MKLSLLCVTKAEPHALPFLLRMDTLAYVLRAEFVLAADGPEALNVLSESSLAARIVPVQSRGYLESVLEIGVRACSGEYVLRLDDDECVSPAMARWLLFEDYLAADHWQFPRLHLWGDEQHFLDDPQLWPDYQTRLSVKAKAGGRDHIHAGSPFGAGETAPCAIEHHKFLVKSLDLRKSIAAQWHGGEMLAFSVPEHARRDLQSLIRPLSDASYV